MAAGIASPSQSQFLVDVIMAMSAYPRLMLQDLNTIRQIEVTISVLVELVVLCSIHTTCSAVTCSAVSIPCHFIILYSALASSRGEQKSIER